MTTRLNVALPNVPGIKSLLLGPASPSRFDISTCSYKWKRNAMENRHDMPLSSLLLFLFPSILISISRIPSNRRSFTLPLFTHFILRISQRFRSIDITQLLSFSHLSLFIPISPLFESLFSKSIPIVVLIFLPFFSLYLEFLFSKDSYLIISPLFSYSLPLSISTSVLSFLSFKDSVQRYRFFSLSLLFFPFFFLFSRSTFSFVSFKDSLFLSFFVQSSIQTQNQFYLYLSFSRFTFIYSNFVLFCTIDRPLKFTFSPTSFFLFLFAASFVGFEGRNRSILPFIQFLSPSPLLPFRFTRSFSFFPFLSAPLSRYRAEQRKKLADRLISGQDTSFFVSSERCVRIVFFSSSSFFSPSLQFTIDSSADTSHPLPSLPCDEHDDYRFIPRRYREAISPLSLDPSWIIFPRDPPCLR